LTVASYILFCIQYTIQNFGKLKERNKCITSTQVTFMGNTKYALEREREGKLAFIKHDIKIQIK
jgi:hypothetical protein